MLQSKPSHMSTVCTDMTTSGGGHGSTLPRGLIGNHRGGGGGHLFENGQINGMDLDMQCPPPFQQCQGQAMGPGEPPPPFQPSPMNPAYGQCGGAGRGFSSSMSINQVSLFRKT